MPNTSMNVSLPEALKEYVQERVAEGTYSNPSDYVRALIREDMKRQAEEKLDALLMEGLDSGPAEPMTAEDWDDIRANLEEHIAKRPADAHEPDHPAPTGPGRHRGAGLPHRRRQPRGRPAFPRRGGAHPRAVGRHAEHGCRAAAAEPGPARLTHVHGGRQFENHLIFYRPIRDGIELVRVLHGMRNVEAVLEAEPDPGGEGE